MVNFINRKLPTVSAGRGGSLSLRMSNYSEMHSWDAGSVRLVPKELAGLVESVARLRN